MKHKFSCIKDKEEFKKILGYNLQLVCGKLCDANSLKIMNFQKELLETIKSVEIVPDGPNEELDTKRMNGCTEVNAKTGTSKILMKGFCNAPEHRFKDIQHTFSHELFHSIYVFMNRTKDGKDSNGNRLFWYGKSNGEKVIGGGGSLVSYTLPIKYGNLFEETMMDIKASMALAEFDKDYKLRNPGVTVDTILSDNVNRWGDSQPTAYAKMVPLTQLMIAAFSNEPDINYHKCIQEGFPMERILTQRKNGERLYANDFLYGMMYDPIHIMEEYDKYMGDGEYIELLKLTDLIYTECLESDKIDTRLMKETMTKIANFANKRTTILKNNGIFSDEEVSRLSGKFNKIWNSILREYNISYNVSELNELPR